MPGVLGSIKRGVGYRIEADPAATMSMTLEQLLQVGVELRSLHPDATLPRIDRATNALRRVVEGGRGSEEDLRARIAAVVRAFVSRFALPPRAVADRARRRPTISSTRVGPRLRSA